MQATIADIVGEMERLAPPRLAEDWDNVGLQVGRGSWPVRQVWTALDPIPAVVEAACRERVDLLVTHHPLIFRPLRSVDLDTPCGRIVARAIRSRLGIYAAHTNLDSAAGGLNDLLAQRLGLKDLAALKPRAGEGHAAAVPGGLSGPETVGLGRIGSLQQETDLAGLARHVRQALGQKGLRMAGDPGLRVGRVALCTGSGSSLLAEFLASDAQVYLSGDLRYHDARAAEEAGRGLIDVGHFASEFLVVVDLARRLAERLGLAGFDVRVTPCGIETDPFRSVD